MRRFFSQLVICLFSGPGAFAFSILTYNVAGNGASDWSTNSPQVQAIGRVVAHLNPDIITFNEVPAFRVHEMTNFVNGYLPGFHLATNSGTDNFIRSVIASRYSITRSQSWLDGASLTNFGYDGTFTRDLFEAEVELPTATERLHVFVAHLKAFQDDGSLHRRAAEASAISNFLVTVFRPAHPYCRYILAGDLNEDIHRPPQNSQMPISRIANEATGLSVATPLNPVTGDDRTISIRAGLSKRFDYILPDGLLALNLATNFVFRSDLDLAPRDVLPTDSRTASDHLPVVAVFNFPDPPLQMTVGVQNGLLSLTWPALVGRSYQVQSSSSLGAWIPVATELATNAVAIWSGNPSGERQFYKVIRLR